MEITTPPRLVTTALSVPWQLSSSERVTGQVARRLPCRPRPGFARAWDDALDQAVDALAWWLQIQRSCGPRTPVERRLARWRTRGARSERTAACKLAAGRVRRTWWLRAVAKGYPVEAPPRTLTIKETAAATGLTIKAIRSCIERGTLPAVVRDGLRRIPYSELVRAGLVEADNGAAIRQLPPQGTAAEAPQPDVLAKLVNRLEAQAEELGRLKAITAAAETTSDQEHERAEQLETEVIEPRAKLAELEAQPRRWWRPRRR